MSKIKGTTIELTSPVTGEVLFSVDAAGNITSPTITNLSPVAVSGSYNDLLDKPAVFVNNLSDLTDVDTSNTKLGQFLVYDGIWHNSDTLQSSSAVTTPLIIQAYTSQSANLLHIQTNSGDPLFSVSNIGRVYSHSNFMVQDITIGTAPNAGDTSNVAVGVAAGDILTDGTENVFVGYSAGLGLSAGADANVIIGSMAAGSNTFTGYFGYNTLVGGETGVSFTSGINNTLIGWGSGSGLQKGNFNTIIGRYDASDAPIVDGYRTLNNTIILSDGLGNVRMNIDSSGNVGIGTRSPSASLDIQGSTTTLNKTRFITTSAGPEINLQKSRGALVGTNTIVQNGDILGVVRFNGANGTNYTEGAYVAAFVDGTPGASNDMPTRLVFATTSDGAGIATERMRIDSSGRIGVGLAPFSWSANGSIDLANGFGAMGLNGASYISSNSYWMQGPFGWKYKVTGIPSTLYAAENGNHIFFRAGAGVAGNSISYTESMIISNVGKVLIGTPNTGGTTDAKLFLKTTGQIWAVGPGHSGGNAFWVTNESDQGVILFSGNSAWSANSDLRDKKNIQDLSYGLDEVSALRPVRFDYNTDQTNNSSRVGFIAQEVLQQIPEAISSTTNVQTNQEHYYLSTTELIPAMVNAIKELKTRVDQLSEDNQQLKDRLSNGGL